MDRQRGVSRGQFNFRGRGIKALRRLTRDDTTSDENEDIKEKATLENLKEKNNTDVASISSLSPQRGSDDERERIQKEIEEEKCRGNDPITRGILNRRGWCCRHGIYFYPGAPRGRFREGRPMTLVLSNLSSNPSKE